MRKYFILFTLLIPVLLSAQDEYIELLRSDIRAQKVE